MEAVLMSVQPKWCELIANGKKTVEVRKNKPNLKTPFKVYLYCTQGKSKNERLVLQPFGYELGGIESTLTCRGNGKIIGEFVCNEISWIGRSNLVVKEDAEKALRGTCLSYEEICDYLGLSKSQNNNKHEETFEFVAYRRGGYGWHISDLVIYDKPKELSEFHQCHTCEYAGVCNDTCWKTLKKPPQSWCYVEKSSDK